MSSSQLLLEFGQRRVACLTLILLDHFKVLLPQFFQLLFQELVRLVNCLAFIFNFVKVSLCLAYFFLQIIVLPVRLGEKGLQIGDIYLQLADGFVLRLDVLPECVNFIEFLLVFRGDGI